MEKELLNTKEAATFLNLSYSTLVLWRKKKKGPPWVNLGDEGRGVIRYSKKTLQEYLNKREVGVGI